MRVTLGKSKQYNGYSSALMFQVASIHTLKIPSCKRDFYSHSGSLNTNQLLDSVTCLSFEEAGHT